MKRCADTGWHPKSSSNYEDTHTGDEVHICGLCGGQDRCSFHGHGCNVVCIALFSNGHTVLNYYTNINCTLYEV